MLYFIYKYSISKRLKFLCCGELSKEARLDVKPLFRLRHDMKVIRVPHVTILKEKEVRRREGQLKESFTKEVAIVVLVSLRVVCSLPASKDDTN